MGGIYRGSRVLVSPPDRWRMVSGGYWTGGARRATVKTEPMKYHGTVVADVELDDGLWVLCVPLRFMAPEEAD